MRNCSADYRRFDRNALHGMNKCGRICDNEAAQHEAGASVGYPIDRKFVIGVASSALFDLTESHRVFVDEGPEKYRQFQEANIDRTLERGVAFPFIRRFLSINRRFPEQKPVEVVLLSRNSPATGLRVFRSIAEYGLEISRAAFMTGKTPYEYIPAFNCALFLTSNAEDVAHAMDAGYPAGLVIPSKVKDDEHDVELRVAFDFDGVIADDASESIFQTSSLEAFHAYETEQVHVPHSAGPLADLFRKLAYLRALEDDEIKKNPQYERVVRLAIVTARSAPAHARLVTTLQTWGVSVDETFFLGGMDKSRVVSVLRPHIFFDDQRSHLSSVAGDIPMVHVPFGVANRNAKVKRHGAENGTIRAGEGL
jgi:5'-nucleotidase